MYQDKKRYYGRLIGACVAAWTLCHVPQALAASSGHCVVGQSLQEACDVLIDVMPARASVQAPRPFPSGDLQIGQAAPVLRWPSDGRDGPYRLQLWNDRNEQWSWTATKNALALGKPLPPGHYHWTVDAADANQDVHSFVVFADGSDFAYASSDKAWQTAVARRHPRFLFQQQGASETADGGKEADRLRAFEATLASDLAEGISDEPIAPAKPMDKDETIAFRAKAKEVAYREADFLQRLSLAWVKSGDRKWRDALLAHAMAVSGWDVNGATGGEQQDLGAGRLGLCLAYAYDALYPGLTEEQRTLIRNAAFARLQFLDGRYIASGLMWKNPINPHGTRHAANIAAAAALMADDRDSDMHHLFDDAYQILPLVLSNWIHADGGVDGGTMYATLDLLAVVSPLDALDAATGNHFFKAPQWVSLVDYLRFFLPPGTPANLFGDGAETAAPLRWAALARDMGMRVHDEASEVDAKRWAQIVDLPPDVDEFTAAPVRGVASDQVSLMKSDAASAVFPSIGWVAMHGDLGDLKGTSVYFHSSPTGVVNHSHGAQNEFVVHEKGVALLIASGSYDLYNSPHHLQWTRQTKSHNAITYDGGQGQPPRDPNALGRITGFGNDDAMSWASGDATVAYRGALKRARRSVVYLRPDIILVYDDLKSSTRRQWEWNVHAMTPFSFQNGSVVVRNGDASACIVQLGGTPSRFETSSGFPVAPLSVGEKPSAAEHATLVSRQKSKAAQFLVAILPDCARGGQLTARRHKDGSFTVGVAGKSIRISGNKVE